jgi:hypothetical protein
VKQDPSWRNEEWVAEFSARVEKAFAGRPYTRPGAPAGMALDATWWALWDDVQASRRRQLERWGADAAGLLGEGRHGAGYGRAGLARGQFFCEVGVRRALTPRRRAGLRCLWSPFTPEGPVAGGPRRAFGIAAAGASTGFVHMF